MDSCWFHLIITPSDATDVTLEASGHWLKAITRAGGVGLGVTWSPQDPRFAGSNPAEVDGFFQDVKILSTSPWGGTLSWGPESEISGSLKNLKSEKIGL